MRKHKSDIPEVVLDYCIDEKLTVAEGLTAFLEDNPLSPPCIPPKFVLHGLSARSKFLAATKWRSITSI